MQKTYIPKAPNTLGITVFENVPLETLRDYIDWTPFFLSWELRGRYPAIFEDKVVGSEAKKLFEEGSAILDSIIAEQSLRAKAVCGFFPANTVNDDDIELYTDETRSQVLVTLNMLRQQSQKSAGQPNLCLADFVAPRQSEKSNNGTAHAPSIPDYIGAFAVTAGIGTDELCKRYEADNDDYSSIMVKAIADRLAEACAEWLHAKVRTEIWGYEPQESLSNEQLIKEEYTGIRPAPGYPACPEHTEKRKLFDLLNAEKNADIILTESYAMFPAASVSGWYFAHPESKYFPLGKIQRDQVTDYARRKGMTLEEAEKWLSPNLGYAA